MKNIFKSKRNILIIMFALIVMMGIGFAAYSQQLQITDKSSIDSNWDIYISKVTPGTPVGGATGTGAPDPDEKTKANLTTDLKYPGDSITYTIDVTNDGTVDAEVEKVELKPTKQNTVIKYSIIDEANIQYLNAGETKSFKVKVEYDPEKTGTAKEEEKTNTLELIIDYVQKGTSSGTYVPGGEKAADMLISKVADTGDGLYADEYENGRYIYKGANPDNYITFNEENDGTAGWRIVGVELDGTLKIKKEDPIGINNSSTAWDRNNSNNWLKPATLNNYLNNNISGEDSYYNSLLSDNAKTLIQNHIWGIGSVLDENEDLSAQILSEKRTTWSGNVGLISVSDYLKANTNIIQCGNFKLNNSNLDICKKTNYLISKGANEWTITPYLNSTSRVFVTWGAGGISFNNANYTPSTSYFCPTVYLKSNITLSGSGTKDDPYTINL